MQRGVIQGDPFCMALFCLAIMPLLKEAVHVMEQNLLVTRMYVESLKRMVMTGIRPD